MSDIIEEIEEDLHKAEFEYLDSEHFGDQELERNEALFIRKHIKNLD